MFSQDSCYIMNLYLSGQRVMSTWDIHGTSPRCYEHLIILYDPACDLMCHWLSLQAGEWCEPITLRPPNEATSSTPVQYWQHHPEKLIFQSCDYEAYVSPSPHFTLVCLYSQFKQYLNVHLQLMIIFNINKSADYFLYLIKIVQIWVVYHTLMCKIGGVTL